MTYASRLRANLMAALSPTHLDIIDESHRHHGHAGWKEAGETHFKVVVVSEAFTGKRLVERHRLINEAVKAELAEHVHALAIEARTPDEWR